MKLWLPMLVVAIWALAALAGIESLTLVFLVAFAASVGGHIHAQTTRKPWRPNR